MNDVDDRGGHLPTWWRRRDAIAAQVSKIGGRRMSDRTLRRATFACKNGCPELREALDQGRLSIAGAALLALLPHDVQRDALALDRQRLRLILDILRNDRGDESGGVGAQ